MPIDLGKTNPKGIVLYSAYEEYLKTGNKVIEVNHFADRLKSWIPEKEIQPILKFLEVDGSIKLISRNVVETQSFELTYFGLYRAYNKFLFS
jgi:hypothetical protein